MNHWENNSRNGSFYPWLRHRNSKPVALKMMRHRPQFLAEVMAREGSELDPDLVIDIEAAHGPASSTDLDALAMGSSVMAPEHTEATTKYPYVLVMPQGERSVHNIQTMERVAGVAVRKVVEILLGVTRSLQELHDHDIVHGELKQRLTVKS